MQHMSISLGSVIITYGIMIRGNHPRLFALTRTTPPQRCIGQAATECRRPEGHCTVSGKPFYGPSPRLSIMQITIEKVNNGYDVLRRIRPTGVYL